MSGLESSTDILNSLPRGKIRGLDSEALIKERKGYWDTFFMKYEERQSEVEDQEKEVEIIDFDEKSTLDMISDKIVGLPVQRTTKEFYKKHADDIEELTTIAGPPASDEEDITEDDSDDEHGEETLSTEVNTGGNLPVNSPNTINDEDDDVDDFFPLTPTSSTKHIVLTPSRNPVVNISRLSHSVVKSRLSTSAKRPETSLYATPQSSIQRTRLSDTVFLTPSTASEFSPVSKGGLFKDMEDGTFFHPAPCSINSPDCPVSSSDSSDSHLPPPCCPSCSISLDKSSLMLSSRALELGDLECDLNICDLCLGKRVKSCTDGNCSRCVDSKSIVNIRKALRASLPVGGGEEDNDERVWANTTNLLESQEI